MPVQYRPARADEMRQFTYANSIAFGGNTSEAEVERNSASGWLKPEWTLCAFEEGEPVAQMATLPFVMRWNGRDIGCGGVTAVSSLPSHRRRGHLRELMTRAFAAMREAGQPLAMLWASMAAIYQRFGYGIAGYSWIYDFDPRHLRFVDDVPTPGRIRLVKHTEARPVIAAAYDAFAAPRTLMLRRDAAWWEKAVLRQWQPDLPPLLVAVYEEAGEALGYTIYEVEQRHEFRNPGPDQTVTTRELVWLTPSAHRALVTYLAGYDLADTVRMRRMPADDPLFHHAQEPRLLETRVRDGTLVRIVDLPAALEGRGYDGDGRLTFAFADDLCPWNDGTWQLSVEAGSGRLTRTDAEPELCLTSRSLAMMASGYQPATTLARIGLIAPAGARALASADALFRTSHAPSCTDGF